MGWASLRLHRRSENVDRKASIRNFGWPEFVVALAAILTAVVYAADNWLRFDRFQSTGVDLGIFDQAIRHYSHFHAPIDAMKSPGFNLLGDHFSPAIAVIAPLYWLWADPRMLGLATAGLCAGSVCPVYTFARRRLSNRNSALAVAIGYLLWWPLQALVAFDFHEIALGVPLMAWLIDALDRGRFRQVLLIAAALLLVREDLGITVAMIAPILLLRRQIRWAAVFGGIGIVAYLVTTMLLIPAFTANGQWQYWNYPRPRPECPVGCLAYSQTSDRQVGLLANSPLKRHTWRCLFPPPFLLSFGSPYLFLAAPVLLSRMFSSRDSLWGTHYQYSAILAPIIVMATVDSLSRLPGFPTGTWLRRVALGLVVVIPLYGLMTNADLYPMHSVLTGQLGSASDHTRAQAWAVRQVPSGVCVEADDHIIPHLLTRDVVTLPRNSGGRATWLVLDMSQRDTGRGDAPTPAQTYSEALDKGFSLVGTRESMRVLSRPGAVLPRCQQID